MPRGNDLAGQREYDAEFVSQFGVHANADEMIREHKRAQDPALRRAQRTVRDPEETEKARADLGACATKLGLGDVEVLDASVRGNALVVSYRDRNGRTHKAVGAWNSSYVAPRLSPQEERIREDYEKDRLIADETARLRAEAEEQITAARREIEDEVKLQIEKLRASSVEIIQQAHESAQQQIAEATQPGKPEEEDSVEAVDVTQETDPKGDPEQPSAEEGSEDEAADADDADSEKETEDGEDGEKTPGEEEPEAPATQEEPPAEAKPEEKPKARQTRRSPAKKK